MRRFGRGIGLESLERRLPMACDVSSGAYCESLELVADIDQSTHPAEIVASHIEGDTLYYVRDTDVALELWRQTADESELLSEIYVQTPQKFSTDEVDSAVRALDVIGNHLFFAVDGILGDNQDVDPMEYDPYFGTTDLWEYDLQAGVTQHLAKLGEWSGYTGATNVQFQDDGGELLMVVEQMAGPTARLWTSDGTREGTSPYTDHFGIQYIGSVQELVQFNGEWYFLGGGWSDYGLWTTTPGESRTLIREFEADVIRHVAPYGLRVVGDQLQLGAYDEFGAELWVSDGTTEGTQLFIDLQPGPASAYARPLQELDGMQWIQARTGNEATWEVWTTDWTTEGTERYTLLPEGFTGVFNSVVFDDAIYIELRIDRRSHVWRMDADSLELAFASDGYRYVDEFEVAGERLFFRTNEDDEETLWVAEGDTPVAIGDFEVMGTLEDSKVVFLQRDGQRFTLAEGSFVPTQSSLHAALPGASRPFAVSVPQGVLTAVTHDRELWVAEGERVRQSALEFPLGVGGPVVSTAEHALFLRAGEFRQGLIAFEPFDNELVTLVAEGIGEQIAVTAEAGALTFLNRNDDFQLEFWLSDGTLQGTSGNVLRDRLFADNQLVGNDGWYYFLARDFSSENNREPHLWVTNGTADSTLEIAPISGLAQLVRYRDGVIAWVPNDADDGETELVLFNATSEPTAIVPHAFDTGPEFTQMATRGEHIYFVEGNRLWYHNGQPGVEARLVVEFPELSLPDYGSALIDNLTVVDHRVFFTVDDGMHGTELWVTDGTKHGTVMAVDVNSGHMPSLPRHLTIHNDQLYFTALTREHGREIWSIDLQDPHAPVNSDISDDGQTDFADFLLLSSNFGNRTNNGVFDGDLDHDGTVDFADFLVLSREIAARLDVIE